MEIKKTTTLEAWKESIRLIRDQGIEVIDREDRKSKEVLNIIITIENPEEDITAPMKVMKGLKKWEYPSLEELEDVFFKQQASSVYHYTYGARMFDYSHSKNQIDDYIIPLLKNQPTSRRGIVVLYHPVIDSKTDLKETPSLISIYFKIIDDKLIVTTLIRSNDMFIGWPANIYQVYLLQKYVAEKLEKRIGALTTISHSAHIFEEYDEEIDIILKN